MTGRIEKESDFRFERLADDISTRQASDHAGHSYLAVHVLSVDKPM